MSHPNCITTFKLSVVRVLTGDELGPAQPSSAPPSICSSGELLPPGTSLADSAHLGEDPPSRLSKDSLVPAGPASECSASSASASAGASCSCSAGSTAPTGSGGGAGGSASGSPSSGAGPKKAGIGGRRLQSLLSGAAVVEIVRSNEVRHWKVHPYR